MRFRWIVLFLLTSLLFGCSINNISSQEADPVHVTGNRERKLKVLAVETYLADIAQNVAGDRLIVETLVPLGVDPHSFEPSPRDLARIAESHVLIINGAGFEEWLEDILSNAGGERLVIDSSEGLDSRVSESDALNSGADEHEGDPHFWLDPVNVIHYVENIQKGLSQVDPEGSSDYYQNSQEYIVRLQELDQWILVKVSQIPAKERLIITNHESFGYFADRYGFIIIGTVVPNVSSNASPSAKQFVHLVDLIRAQNAKAVFLETGTNRQLADQLAAETGVKVIDDLYTHSLSRPEGPAPTYITMLEHNVMVIVDALVAGQ